MEAVGGVGGLDDGFVVGDERVVGAVAYVGLLGDVGFASEQGGGLAHMLFVVDAGGVECFGLKGDEQADGGERAALAGFGVIAEWGAVHFFYLVAADDAERYARVGLVSCPAHMRSLLW